MRLGSAWFVPRGIFIICLFVSLASGQSVQPSRSDVCGECHRDIYRMWHASAHAQAMEDPIFLDAYRETERRERLGSGRICLGCHAPAVEITKDYELEKKVSWEGVSCDVCHGISAVDFTERGPKLVFDWGRASAVRSGTRRRSAMRSSTRSSTRRPSSARRVTSTRTPRGRRSCPPIRSGSGARPPRMVRTARIAT